MTRAILIVASLMVLICCAPAQAALSAFPVDGLARVRRYDTVFSNTTASIKAARNEYEPFQIVVRAGGEGLKSVNLEASDLRGEDGDQNLQQDKAESHHRQSIAPKAQPELP